MRAAGLIGLPRRGPLRYRAPAGYNAADLLPIGPGGGYLDRFGNEWQEGPPHGRAAVEGHAREWDVQLSHQGMNAWRKLAKTRGGLSYVNITKDGNRSH